MAPLAKQGPRKLVQPFIETGVRLLYQLMKGGRLDEAQHVLDQIRALPPPADSDPGVDLVATLLATRLGNFADTLAEASGACRRMWRRASSPRSRAPTVSTSIGGRLPQSARRSLRTCESSSSSSVGRQPMTRPIVRCDMAITDGDAGASHLTYRRA
jgi:hypothetical protein